MSTITLKPPVVDELDMGILNLLTQQAEVSVKSISKQLHITAGNVENRIDRLKAQGIIEGPYLKINFRAIGYGVVVFLGVHLVRGEVHDLVITRLKKIPVVIRVFTMTGPFSLLVEMVCADTDHLRTILHDHIQVIPGVIRTESMISLQQDFSR